MLKFPIYFQDLKEDTQQQIWETLQRELLATGDVEYRQEDESEDEFQTRLQEHIDDYINRHNVIHEFCL